MDSRPIKMAILLLAWGAGTLAARSRLGHFEKMCRQRYPGVPVRWAYTSTLSRERLSRMRCKSDSVAKAIRRLYYEKYEAVAVQPLQIIPGRENDLAREAVVEASRDTGICCAVGEPLLGCRQRFQQVCRALLLHIPDARDPSECVVYMGHGSKSEGMEYYRTLGMAIAAIDRNVRVGVMNGSLELDNILPGLLPGRVWLMPLLATLGRHTVYDMAGPDGNSWRNRIERAGFTCVPVLKSLAESPPLAQIWLENLGDAIASLRCPIC